MEIVYQDQVDDMTAAMQEVLDKYPQLDGVFCDNADIADLYLDMKKDETKDSIVMVGVDATAKQQEAIRNSKEVGVVSQQPYAMGYQTIWTALLTTYISHGFIFINSCFFISCAFSSTSAVSIIPFFSKY